MSTISPLICTAKCLTQAESDRNVLCGVVRQYRVKRDLSKRELLYVIPSTDSIYILTQLIHKITGLLLPLWRHGLILKPSETFTLLSLTGNAVYILKHVLMEMLSVEGMTYNNSLLLKSLFTLYCLTTPQRTFLSDSACVKHLAVQISGDIVDICSAYLTDKVVTHPL